MITSKGFLLDEVGYCGASRSFEDLIYERIMRPVGGLGAG